MSTGVRLASNPLCDRCDHEPITTLHARVGQFICDACRDLCRTETTMQPEPIPVADRYGECENGNACPGVYQVIKRKPMFVLDGLRLCTECTRKAQA